MTLGILNCGALLLLQADLVGTLYTESDTTL